jgi:hypothetical protein
MAERKAVTKQMLARYRDGTKTVKGRVLDELCALTGWNRDHARKALRTAMRPAASAPPRRPRQKVYGPEVLVPLRRSGRCSMDPPASGSRRSCRR